MANKKIFAAFTLVFCLFCSFQVFAQTDTAAAATTASPHLNPAFILLVSVAVIFAFLIAVLGYVLVSLSGVYVKKPLDEDGGNPGKTTAVKSAGMLAVLLLVSGLVNAQEPAAGAVETGSVSANIAGMTPTAFFLLILTIFIETIIVFVLLWNISNLVKKSKQASGEPGKSNLRWWVAAIVAFLLFNGVYIWKNNGPEPEVASATAIKKEEVNENTVKILTGKGDLDAGKEIFIKSCVVCHGNEGEGVIGPNLTDNFWLHGANIKNIFHTVHDGINAMPPWKTTYSNKEIEQVCSYVVSLHGTHPKNPKAPEGKEEEITDQAATGNAAATDSTASPAK